MRDHEPLDFNAGFYQTINGQMSAGESSPQFKAKNAKKALPLVPLASAEDLDRSVDAARQAAIKWSAVLLDERRRLMQSYADAVNAYKEEFTRLLSFEQGKPYIQATDEVDAAFRCIRELTQLQLKDEVIEDSKDRKVLVRYHPVGVVGAIIPWNFPLFFVIAKIAPALLVGNVVILKPSPLTPYCALKLVELAQGFFPPGVVQCLSGDDSLGARMTRHSGIDHITFTGSIEAGKQVMQNASSTLKNITLELGGNDPAIIFPDVDVAQVAQKVAHYCLLNSGQTCINIKRIYVHDRIYEDFKSKLLMEIRKFKFADGPDKSVTHGPIQNYAQFIRLKELLDEIKNDGMTTLKPIVHEENDATLLLHPVIVDRPPDRARVVTEEPFGPIIPLLIWRDEEDVINRANDSKMGLGASVWTQNIKKADEMAHKIQAGVVWINDHLSFSTSAPFGGIKESGFGTEWGLEGLKALCNRQTVYINKT